MPSEPPRRCLGPLWAEKNARKHSGAFRRASGFSICWLTQLTEFFSFIAKCPNRASFQTSKISLGIRPTSPSYRFLGLQRLKSTIWGSKEGPEQCWRHTSPQSQIWEANLGRKFRRLFGRLPGVWSQKFLLETTVRATSFLLDVRTQKSELCGPSYGRFNFRGRLL